MDTPDERREPASPDLPDRPSEELAGISKIEAFKDVWGPKGKLLLYPGLAIVMLVFELETTTVGSYQTYATSALNHLSMLSTITTVGSISSTVSKPIMAKLADVLGRAEAFTITTVFAVLAHTLCATSKSFGRYASGYVFYAISQTGFSLLAPVLIADLTSMRWRAFAYNIINVPFIITPWISGFIVNSVVNGIGWRWGIGMFAILTPFSTACLIIPLLVMQHIATRKKQVSKQRMTLYTFCSQVDLGGLCLLCGGFALILLPITVAATTPSRWRTPWVSALIVVGVLLLGSLYLYERHVTRRPIVPLRYFKSRSILISFFLACLDNVCFACTHSYLFPWAIAAHNYSALEASYLNNLNGVVQCIIGIAIGLAMYKTRSYKWLGVAGAVIRLVGYGVMVRLRTNNSSAAELFLVQATQGVGSGIIATITVVAVQILVPNAELAQATSLVLLGGDLGQAIGTSIAGGIYTGTLKERLRVRLGPGHPAKEVDAIFNSITGTLPDWNTPERRAVSQAFSDVMGYISMTALAISVPLTILALIMPNKRLGDGHSLVTEEATPPAHETLR